MKKKKRKKRRRKRRWTSFLPMHKRAFVQVLTSLSFLFLVSVPRLYALAIVIGFSFRDRAKTARWKYITGSQLQPDWRLGIGRQPTTTHHGTSPGTHHGARGGFTIPVAYELCAFRNFNPIYLSNRSARPCADTGIVHGKMRFSMLKDRDDISRAGMLYLCRWIVICIVDFGYYSFRVMFILNPHWRGFKTWLYCANGTWKVIIFVAFHYDALFMCN